MTIAYPPISLARIMASLGAPMLSLSVGDPLQHADIREVVIYEGADVPLPPAALVLLIGMRGPEDLELLLPEFATAGVHAVIVREPFEVAAKTADAVNSSGVALLTVQQDMSWTQLTEVLRSVIFGHTDDPVDATPVGRTSNLFTLADAVGSLLHAPITIEDRHSRVIAFSRMQGESDESRISTILGRQVPELYRQYLADHGVFDHLHRSDETIYVSADLPGARFGRIAVALRVGDEFLGSMWAAVSIPLTVEQDLAFRTSANLIALHIRRQQERTIIERRLRADLVTTALAGGTSAAYSLNQLGIGSGPMLVIALGIQSSSTVSEPQDLSELIDALAVHLGTHYSSSAVAMIKGLGYAIFALPASPTEAENQARQRAEDFLSYVRDDAIMGIGRPVTHPLELVRSRDDAERALSVVRAGRTTSRVATFNEIHVDALLLRIADEIRSQENEIRYSTISPIGSLADSDALHGTSFMPTLAAWLDAFGNVGTASASLNIHPNSFRYRLRQLRRITDCDLEDPDTRFRLMLHLRLLGLQKPTDSGGRCPEHLL